MREVDDAFVDYIIFPKRRIEVSRMEMEKERLYGGIKLINTRLKSLTPKVHWLVNLTVDENLKSHLYVFECLVGEQRGRLRPRDVIFADRSYVSHCLDVQSEFYREAFGGMSRLNVWKHVPDLRDEHVFYNPVFSVTDDDSDDILERTLKPFRGNLVLGGIRTYGELVDAATSLPGLRLRAAVRKKLDSIKHVRGSVLADEIVGHDHKSVEFKLVTQKFIYSQLVHQKSVDHGYQARWSLGREDLDLVLWDGVWGSLHSQFYTETVKSTVWEQIHLNFYTTYNYGVWHDNLLPCPFCRGVPEDVFHIILDCPFVLRMWGRVENLLLRILPVPVTIYERAFGVQPRSGREEAPTVLRNWITFSLRHHIMAEERRAYHLGDYTPGHEQDFMRAFNDSMQEEIIEKQLQYSFRGVGAKFEALAGAAGVLCKDGGGKYIWEDV